VTTRTLRLDSVPERFLNRDQLAERLGLQARQVARLGLPRYPGARGGLYVWEEVVAEMQRRKAQRENRRAS
jgi:hypothetical protein